MLAYKSKEESRVLGEIPWSVLKKRNNVELLADSSEVGSLPKCKISLIPA